MNAMIYIRGHPHDYDSWAAAGNDGWAYEDVLPYFRRSEHNTRGADEYHGDGGEYHVTDLTETNVLSERFVEAGEEAGLDRTPDFNDGEQTGVGFYQVAQKDGSRHSNADAFLKPVLDREALTAETHAQVTDIRFDGTTVEGITYRQNGTRVDVDVREDVVVCGGAVESPKLLMCSGIGPAEHLAEHDIEVVADLPVGQNLQDHLVVTLAYECTRGVTLDDADGLLNFLKFALLNRGPLTSNAAEAGGFERTDPALPAPDLQYHFVPAFYLRHGFDNPEEGYGFGVGPTLLRPESRGELRLRSADPTDDPVIDPNYLDADGDLEVLVEGIRRSREFMGAAPFDEFRGAELEPGPETQTDEELAEYVRGNCETIYHPVGTCKMGSGVDAVVDEELRVHGVDGLRVVDASIMPTIVGGNTNAPTTMIAEKAAAAIRDGV